LNKAGMKIKFWSQIEPMDALLVAIVGGAGFIGAFGIVGLVVVSGFVDGGEVGGVVVVWPYVVPFSCFCPVEVLLVGRISFSF
jgi:hypothetical protein